MRRFIATLLSCLVLLLSGMPCDDVWNEGSNGNMIEHSVARQSAAEHDCPTHCGDLCSPFCTCSCCAGIAMPVRMETRVLPVVPRLKNEYPQCVQTPLQRGPAAIWQPPRTV